MAEVNDTAQAGHALEDSRWRQVEVEGRHADLSLVAEFGPDAEVEAGNRRCHLSAPEIGVFQLADEGEGHGFSARRR